MKQSLISPYPWLFDSFGFLSLVTCKRNLYMITLLHQINKLINTWKNREACLNPNSPSVLKIAKYKLSFGRGKKSPFLRALESKIRTLLGKSTFKEFWNPLLISLIIGQTEYFLLVWYFECLSIENIVILFFGFRTVAMMSSLFEVFVFKLPKNKKIVNSWVQFQSWKNFKTSQIKITKL